MPNYHPRTIEPKWQQFWETRKTFRCPDPEAPEVAGKPKIYILDMFPYPSGAGLHVGHPEGYTATDILARFKRMRGFHVLHPMGWDAFGLPAEQYAIKNNVHPRITTQQNINNFRRQIKSLGFSYDWDREVDTTDPDYVKWTQWIFLELYDTWYDHTAKKGRPISELPIPAEVQAQGALAISSYRDSKRLAFQANNPVNWCPGLGTVLANEEVIDGKSEVGGFPVERRPLRQWILRITEYAERLLEDLEPLDWSESIKTMQRNWIGKSIGAEVEFLVSSFKFLVENQSPSNQKLETRNQKLTVFTTRPDTLYGATYMVLSPEHALVNEITTPEQKEAVTKYQEAASRKSDFERTEVAKTKTGVFTGAYAKNPVNGKDIPIWIADYVLAGYGTGAIMAVPAHDERDFEFAKQFGLPIQVVVGEFSFPNWVIKLIEDEIALKPRQNEFVFYYPKTQNEHLLKLVTDKVESLPDHQRNLKIVPGEDGDVVVLSKSSLGYFGGFIPQHKIIAYTHPLSSPFIQEGLACNSGSLDGLATLAAKEKMIAELEAKGLGSRKVNYKLRDWLFSRQRYWGEPFPILHEVDANGERTGVIEPLTAADLPLRLPELEDFKPTGSPEGPLVKAQDWVKVTRNGKTYHRETNTMPQWAGSCWYYLRYIDPKNANAFCDPAKVKHWLPVDLYVGGAEHAVLHLLYSRFWHKVLFDRGHVPCPEPFHRLVNQGLILGETEFTGFSRTRNSELGTRNFSEVADSDWVSSKDVSFDGSSANTKGKNPEALALVKLPDDQVEKQGEGFVLKSKPEIRVDARAFKMSKSRGNVVNPDTVIHEYGADSLRLYEMFMGPLEAMKPWNMRGVEGVYRFLNRVWRLLVDDMAETLTLSASVKDVPPDTETLKLLHKTIQKVTEDTDGLRFNTAIAAMMEFTNHLTGKLEVRPISVLKPFVLILAPYAPHLAEELWELLGNQTTLAHEPWPTFDPALVKEAEIEIPVQINGKVKAKLLVPADADAGTLEKLALADATVIEQLAGKPVKKVIVKPKQMISLVV